MLIDGEAERGNRAQRQQNGNPALSALHDIPLNQKARLAQNGTGAKSQG
jgi:hypothetical protein